MADGKTSEQAEVESQDRHDVPNVAPIEEVEYGNR